MRNQPGIVKRGERWKATYELGCDPVSGQRRQRSKTFGSYEEAKAWRAERVAEVARGVRVDAGGITLGRYLEEWLEESVRPRAEITRRNLRSVVSCHIAPSAVCGIRLRDLTPTVMRRFYAGLPEEGTTRFRVHSALSRALREAVRLELLARNPVEGLHQPYERVRDGVLYLEAEEIGRLLSCLQQAPPFGLRKRFFTGMYHACHLDFHTGLRLGELLGLKWESVRLDTKTVRVEKGKTAKSRRTIEIDGPTVDVLRERRLTQVAECGRVERVHTYSDGEPIGHGVFEGWFDRAVGEAKVNRITPHGMRHTHATMLLQEWDIFYVSRRLGHSSVKVTDERYGHLISAERRSRVGRSFGEIVGGGA